jgi:hypothetical protein
VPNRAMSNVSHGLQECPGVVMAVQSSEKASVGTLKRFPNVANSFRIHYSTH